MNCPFCAEEIQEQAVLCRFCGATKADDGWQAPRPAQPDRPSGQFTIRTAAVFFVLSAAFELLGLTAPVPIFGGVREGVVSVLYHLAFAGLFAGVGVGLWLGTRWGFHLVMATTAIYTLDRAAFIADQRTLEEYLGVVLAESEKLVGPGGSDLVMMMLTVVTGTFVLCWWGFAIYIWWRRPYFGIGADTDG